MIATTARVFPTRPSKQQALGEIQRFFELLKRTEVQAAGAAIAHAGSDWWPHQVRSLWQDLVGPWLEERGEAWELDDDATWRDLTWLDKIGVDLDCHWNALGDGFFVNVVYDGVVTDVSAEFSLHAGDGGWVVRREAIKIA